MKNTRISSIYNLFLNDVLIFSMNYEKHVGKIKYLENRHNFDTAVVCGVFVEPRLVRGDGG